MPILKAESQIFPEGIFGLPEAGFPWWVAHTRSRQEKTLARYLLPLEIPFYGPCREQKIRRAGRTFVSYLPLFSGYVFFRGSPKHRHAVLRSDLIVKVLEVSDQRLLNEELWQIRRLQEAGASFVPFRDLVPGEPVLVKEGPFKGYTGIVLRARGRLRLVVSISMLRQAVAVELERDLVQPVHSRESAERLHQGLILNSGLSRR
jgi:transcription antitermination factor NusG